MSLSASGCVRGQDIQTAQSQRPGAKPSKWAQFRSGNLATHGNIATANTQDENTALTHRYQGHEDGFYCFTAFVINHIKDMTIGFTALQPS